MYQGRAVAAGFAIGLAGLLNCYFGGGLQGALAFGIGLLIVCSLKLDLLTGKMRAWYEKKINWKELIIVFLGNGLGIFFMYGFGAMLPGYLQIKETATAIIASRAELSFGVIFMRAALCGMCVQIAVDMFNKTTMFGGEAHPFLAMLPASAFVLLGCNHCIADLFYLFYSDAYAQSAQIFEAMAGNLIGALLFVVATSDIQWKNPSRKLRQKSNNNQSNVSSSNQDS